MRTIVSSALIALTVMAASAIAGTISGVTVTPVSNPPQSVAGETTGPDGNVWFVAWKDNAIGRLTADGSTTLFPLPTPNSNADQITAGGDGNLWFTEMAGRVGRITPQGVITEFTVGPSLFAPSRTIVSGSDGALWFLGLQATAPPRNYQLGRIATDGTLTSYDLGSSDTFITMASGADGRLWLYDSTRNAVVAFSTTKGTVAATYPIPTPAGQSLGFINHFALGPDGNMWLTHNNSLVRIKRDGTMTDYPVPTANAAPSGLVYGGDGSLWFIEYSAKKLGQLIVSTATDSGQATINESGAVFMNGALDLTLLTGSPAPQPQALDTGIVAPCEHHTAYSWHTVEGVWVATTWQVGPDNLCADLVVDGGIYSTTINRSRRSEFASSKTTIECWVSNHGPSPAIDMNYLCNTFGASIVMSTARMNVGQTACTYSPNGNGVTIHSDSLVKGGLCEFVADAAVTDDNEFGIILNAWSDDVDPHPENNIRSAFYSITNGVKVQKPKKIPVAATKRGQ